MDDTGGPGRRTSHPCSGEGCICCEFREHYSATSTCIEETGLNEQEGTGRGTEETGAATPGS